MSDAPPKPGTIGWRDLTVPDAKPVRDFYQAVVGWTSEPVDMDGYDDYVMFAPGLEEPIAGVCHARGPNLALHVDSLPRALPALLADVEARGAKLVHLSTHHATLEDVFVSLTGRELRDA